MVVSKVFKTELEKVYWNIAEGLQDVNERNVEQLWLVLPKKDSMLMSRKAIADILRDNLEQINGKNMFNDFTFKTFMNTPSKFNYISTMRHSFFERSLKDSKDAMGDVNTYYGHFSVAIEIISYLLTAKASILNDYENLNRKYDELVVKTKGLQDEVDKCRKIHSLEENIIAPRRVVEVVKEDKLTETENEEEYENNQNNETEEEEETDPDAKIIIE